MSEWSPRAQAICDWAASVAASRSGELDFDSSSAQLRDFVKRRLLSMTDLRDDPEFFFEAQRAVSYCQPLLGAGFFTRLTVQYNLFAGTVLAVGGEEQVKSLETMQEQGLLGCFGLTEVFAGVSSGGLVETQAVFDAATREFVISSPNDGARKNWISQGFVADKGVVIAELAVGGKACGTQAFLMDFRVEKDGRRELAPGVEVVDMGPKTASKDLDNGRITFRDVRVPQSALLNKVSYVDEAGAFVARQKGLGVMDTVGLRLYTGRVAIGQNALAVCKDTFRRTKQYTDEKHFFAGKGVRPPLTMLPQLTVLYAEAEAALAYATDFATRVEAEICRDLREDKRPTALLASKIATCKVRSVETAISLLFRLKQAVGSRALMIGSGFEFIEGLQVNKFAEGETYVLMAKLARDRVKAGKVPQSSAEEEKLVKTVQEAGANAWLEVAEESYRLAELVMDRLMEEVTGKPVVKGVARPLASGL